MNLSAITGNRAIKLLKATFDDWMEDGALRLSAALAYYSIFSIAPLLVIAISVAGLALGDEAVRGQLDEQLKAYVGPKAAEAVQSMVQSASKPSHGWIGAVVGFVTLMVGASGVFGQLKDALNTIWEVKARPGAGICRFVRERLLNFGMVLVIGFLLLTSLLISTALVGLTGHIADAGTVLGTIVGFLVSVGVVTMLFALIFKVLPDAQIEWRHVWIGALVTALLFEVGKFGLSFYLGRESTQSSFGAAGSVVLLLLWVYYASCILLFGAEFTQVYARESGHEIVPSPGAEAVTPESRAQQGLAPSAAKVSNQTPAHTRVITISATPTQPSPVAMLLAVTAASFVVGLLARRRAEEVREPTARIRDGLADLGEESMERVSELLRRGGEKVARRFA
jgi:membrane protein